MLTFSPHDPSPGSHWAFPPKDPSHAERVLGLNTTGRGHRWPPFDKTPFPEVSMTLRELR